MSELKPGPELDRMVAEKVMGKAYHRPSGFEMQYEGTEPWEPSINIAHAWEVVESESFCDPDGYRRHYFEITETAIGWRVSILHKTDNRRSSTSVEVLAKTAQLAICLAALKSFGAIKE